MKYLCFRFYWVIRLRDKRKESRDKDQESRVKMQDSRIKSQERREKRPDINDNIV